MIVITGRMNIPDANRKDFFDISTRQVRLSREEAGCLSYWLFEDAMAPGTFFFYEEWKDRDAVDFHFKQDYCLDFVKRLRKLTSGEADMKIRTIAEKPAKSGS
ncbi:MAG: antibiotic biosynthesis monooxygenase [Parvibaculum sp.]|uniref:putative quinol monooxygenase n=1 Tax=Parvibaculum sp. TaxID=2024848 RepID=UPI0025E067DE|nr:putative quinol monooxygenase [Parvibaculum sp.]MCE9648392.1 antibiotic biosynthesis monooxygenase [Parvibaculum sp.]